MAGNSLFIPLWLSARNWSVRDLFSLIKGHLSLYIALTAVAGHALAQNRLTLGSLGLGGWVLLLSCGAGILNNIQDRDHDRHLDRTKQRVLARGDMGATFALSVAAGFILTALLGLWFFFDRPGVSGLGLGAVLLYNGIYTPVKQRSVRARFWAMVPGTLCGMIPPAMGWAAVAETRAVADLSGILILMAGIGVWQFPHFLLVFLREGAENLTEPGTNRLTGEIKEGLVRVLVWGCLFSASMILFLLEGWIVSPSLSGLLFLVALSLPMVLATLFIRAKSRRQLDLGFWVLNLSMLAYLVLILLDRI